MGGEKNCIAYCLFCILIITIIIVIISSSISSTISICFVVLLNCVYLNPWVSPLSISPPHPAVGEGRGEQVAIGSWLLAPELDHDKGLLSNGE